MALKIYDTWCLSVVTFLTFLSAFKSAWAYGFENYDTWCLSVMILLTFSTLLTFPPFQKVPSLFKSAQIMMELFDIPTNPEISIIIQISLRLWFQKGMSLYVCSNIPEILNIPEIRTIPEIPIIIQITLSLWLRKCMTLGVCLSLLTFSTFLTFLTFRNAHYSWSYCLDLLPCKIWRS